MKRIILTAAALLAVVPASLGLLGNASFAQSVPVRVPAQATVLDDNGGQSTHAETGHDKASDSGSGNGDNGVDDSLNGGKDDGSGH